MKKYGFPTLLIWALSALAFFGLPWWIGAIGAALAGFIYWRPAQAFALGTTAGTLLWSAIAGFFNNINGGLLSAKIGQLFQGLQSWQLILVTGLIGGLVLGMAAMSGALARDLTRKDKYRRRRRR